jgi:hypothetical protein
MAEWERDPSDVGVARVLSVTDLDEVRAQRSAAARADQRRAAELPSGPTATERIIERTRAVHGVPRSPKFHRLRSRCEHCEASVGRWCRRKGSEVVGYIHDGRPEPTDPD